MLQTTWSNELFNSLRENGGRDGSIKIATSSSTCLRILVYIEHGYGV